MDCILIRHGIAIEVEEWAGAETDRPLTEKGARRVRDAAAGLAAMDVAPTHLLSSPFARARDTAHIIRGVLCRSVSLDLRNELAVGSTPERVLAMLRGLPRESVVVCVGHEPLLGETAALLLSGHVSGSFPLKKSGAACIILPNEVSAGRGLLQWWLPPAQLRALGKP